jgi:phosphate-selective porin OprO/OprP
MANIMGSRTSRTLAVVLFCLSVVQPALGQQRGTRRDTTGLTAGEADDEPKRRRLFNLGEIDWGFMTIHFGAGLLMDGANYWQDSTAMEQIAVDPDLKLRDARALFGGRFNTKRSFTWQLGVMYDQVKKEWLFRQSGLMVAVPEISSHFFVGRAKEGFSLNKVMVGYDGWSMERLPFTDATVPLLADGIKWLGNAKDRHLFWNLGWFNDAFSEGQSFSHYNFQFVARVGWVPMVSDSIGKLLHLAMNLQMGDPDHDTLRLRSKPEAFPAPNYIDTGAIPAESAIEWGPEIYYRPGRILLGGEYYWMKIDSPEMGHPLVHGGEVVFTWLTTGEVRSYNTVGNYFRGISPKKTVFEGGPGAWELVLKLSYSDLNDGFLHGGSFWRFTPMVNWHLTDHARLEFAYGYGKLNRFGLIGVTQFFQTRIQLQL